MNDSFLIVETSAWWVLIFALLSAGIAFLTYQKAGQPWSKTTAIVLAFIRFTGLLAIFLLISNPLINNVSNEVEPPEIAIAIDNSLSVVSNEDSSNLIGYVENAIQAVEKAGYSHRIFDLTGDLSLTELTFNQETTDLTKQISEINSKYDSRNLGAVIMMTDGIYNAGNSPRFRNSLYPFFTIGLGDTTAVKDISILQVNANKVVYQGNRFPIQVLIASNGFSGQTGQVLLIRNGEIIASQVQRISETMTLNFENEAVEPGLARYEVRIEALEEESSVANNRISFYVDVVEGKENILILAKAPHPDIRALRNAIENSENYSTDVFIPGITEIDENKEYDVVIVHQAFSPNFRIPDLKGDPSYWYFLDRRSNIAALPEAINTRITLRSNSRDNVRPAYNPSFSKFILSDPEPFDYYPTLDVPFGDYEILGPQEVLLFQRVGNVLTDRPLLSIYDDGDKRFAVAFASGIWKWPLQETAFNQSTESFDNLVLRTIQFLSVRNDKRKFIFDPARQTFREGESIVFQTESYNDLYERVGGNEIDLSVYNSDDEQQNFQFVANATSSTVYAGSMPEGIYTYVASTSIGNEYSEVRGEFLVENVNLEYSFVQADHDLLRELSARTGGTFYLPNELDRLANELSEKDFKNRIRSSREFIPLINKILILLIVTVLFAIEWGTRKFLGSY